MQESFYPTTDVHYNAAKQRMATLLGIVDDQSVLAYLGRPETVAKNRVSQTVRYHSGAVVNKNHTFIRRLPAKKGYIEIFGLGHVYFKNDEWRIHWNHSEQSTLPLSYQSEQQHCFYYQGERDGGKVSKEDISLPNIGIGNKQAKLMETHTETIEKEKRECI